MGFDLDEVAGEVHRMGMVPGPEGKDIIDLNVTQWFLTGWIDRLGFTTILTDEGFGTEEIEEFFALYEETT